MEPTRGYANRDCSLPTFTSTAASASASASRPPPECPLTHALLLNSIDCYNSYGGAHRFSPLPDLQTLESGFSQLGLSDSNARRQQQQSQPPLWNSGGSNQRFVDIQETNVGGYRLSPTSRLETEREQINQLQRLCFQNDCVNGSFGFDDPRLSCSLMGQDWALSNRFRDGNLGEVPYLPRNNFLDQRLWASSTGSMIRNHNLGRIEVSPGYCTDFVSLDNPANATAVMAKDRKSYHQLRNIIVEGPKESFDGIFNNVVFSICELMVDPFGHHVVQKLIERCSEEQLNQVLVLVTRNPSQLVEICNESHGTRVIQGLLSRLKSHQQISCFMAALCPIALPLTKNTNGGHVLLYCLSRFPLDSMHLLEVIAQRCYQIAIDQHGCCMLQQFITHATGELRQRLLQEIIAHALRLANHCYGNYVVQFVLELNDPRATTDLLRQLQGSFAYLSRDKYGSHVVQRFLSHLRREDSRRIVCELLRDLDMLLVDPYGNYVIQTAWVVSKDDLRDVLVGHIRQNDQLMRCNRYGKKVMEKLNCL